MCEHHLEMFFSLSLDMLCIASPDGFMKRVNPAFTRVTGWSEAELLSRPFMDFVHPDDRAATAGVLRTLSNGKALPFFENRYVCKDGSNRWLSWTSSAALAMDGLLYAVARDITEQKSQAEAREDLLSRLQDSHAKIKSLEGLLPVCAWCHRIRDEEGLWDNVESYIERHTDAEFTHSICPQCQARNFPESEHP